MESANPVYPLSRWARWGAVALLLLFFARLMSAAAQSSATFDEPLHLFGSAVYWQVKPLLPVIDNPLLINALLGLPQQLLFNPTLPLDHPFWGERFATLALSSAFLWESNENGLQMLLSGRLIIMELALLTAALLYGWGRLWTRAYLPALIALFLFTFDPNVLAHGNLATTDMGTVFFVCLAVFLFWCYWQRPGWAPYLGAGVALGLAVSSKFSGVALLPALALMTLYQGWRKQGALAGLLHSLLELAGWLALAVLVLLVVERFDLAMLLTNLEAVRGAQRFGHASYLLGEVSQSGWWYYFPVVFLAKTPVPTLLLLAAAVVVPLWRRRLDWQQGWLWLVIVAWVGAGLISRINVGYRHLLPILPLLYLQVGLLFRPAYLGRHTLSRLAYLALAAVGVVSLLGHPHYLAYFNRLAGGSENGQRIAVDSNLDWGQDLATLADVLAEYTAVGGSVPVKTALFSTTPPAVYGIPTELLPAWPLPEEPPEFSRFYPPRPAAGLYAISATNLQGVYLEDPDRFAYFRGQQPVARAGYSISVYDLLPDGPPASLAFSGVGITDMSPEGYSATVDTNNITLRWYDARRSLVWVPARDGWSLVGDGHLPTSPLLAALYPPVARTELAERSDEEDRLFHYFQWPDSPFSRLDLAAPETREGDAGIFFAPAQGEVTPEPALAFAGHTSLPEHLVPGTALELLTVWRILAAPGRQFSLFLHLLDESGAIVAQHDGWDVQLSGLAPGDEVAQLHTMMLPEELPKGNYTLRLGVYDIADGRRFLVNAPSGDSDGLVLRSYELPAP